MDRLLTRSVYDLLTSIGEDLAEARELQNPVIPLTQANAKITSVLSFLEPHLPVSTKVEGTNGGLGTPLNGAVAQRAAQEEAQESQSQANIDRIMQHMGRGGMHSSIRSRYPRRPAPPEENS